MRVGAFRHTIAFPAASAMSDPRRHQHRINAAFSATRNKRVAQFVQVVFAVGILFDGAGQIVVFRLSEFRKVDIRNVGTEHWRYRDSFF